VRVVSVRAVGLSYRYPRPAGTLSIGTSVKKDVVLVRVEAENGMVGWGESHHALSPTTLVEYINTTLAGLVVGQSVFDTEGIWQRVQRRVVRSHSIASGAVIAYSGIDMALWDLKGKVLDAPVYALLGGDRKAIPTYSGSITMGFLEPGALVAEVARIVETGGFRAVKLRVGDSPRIDLERVGRVREAFGDDFTIMVDANTGYDPVDLYSLLPGLGDLRVAWLEEPYPPDDVAGLAELRRRSPVPIAVGENLFGRAQFAALLAARAADVLQPDPSKCGGITELKKIADLAEMSHARIAPHATHSALNYSASLHVLSSTSAGYYFESSVPGNPFIEDAIVADVWPTDGMVIAPEGPGLGVTVHESKLNDYPAIPGSQYTWS
jgi:D-galactarolactone cycloisomerase